MDKIRINKVLRELEIPLLRAKNILEKKGYKSNLTPNSLISEEEYNLLKNIFYKKNHSKYKAQEYFEISKNTFNEDKNNLKSSGVNRDKIEFSNDFSEFNDFDIYELKFVYHFINKNDKRFIVGEINNKFYSFPFNYPDITFNIGEFLKCNISYYKETKAPYFKITRAYLINKLYIINERYKFTLEDKVINEELGTQYWVLKDHLNLLNHYHVDNDMSFSDHMYDLEIGDDIELYILNITEKGFLKLAYEKNSYEKRNYLVEEIFNEIGYTDKQNIYFFNFFSANNTSNNSYLTQYNEGENLWVFTYFSLLDSKIIELLDEGNFEECKIIIDIYIKIENWILYRSDFLKNFSSYKVADIKVKAEHKSRKLQGLYDALILFIEGKEIDYLTNLNIDLNKTIFIQDRDKNVLKGICNISQYFSSDLDDELLIDTISSMIKKSHISKNDSFEYSNPIYKKISRISTHILEVENNSIDIKKQTEFKSIIKKQYLLLSLLIIEDRIDKCILSSVNLLKYLAIYYNDSSYLNLCFKLIARGSYIKPNLIKFNNIFKITKDDFDSLICDVDANDMYFKGSGKVERINKKLNIIPYNLYKGPLKNSPLTVFNFDPHPLNILSHYEIDSFKSNLNTKELITSIESLINFKKEIYTSDLANSNYEKVYRGKVKSISKTDHYCFLKCRIDNNSIDTLFHINNIAPAYTFSSFDDIIYANDLVNFHINEIVESKIHIKCSVIFEDYANSLFTDSLQSYGKVINIYKDDIYIISSDGLIIKAQSNNLKINDIVDFNIIDFNSEDMFFIVDENSIKTSNMPWNYNSTTQLFRSFLLNSGIIYDKNSSLSVNQKNYFPKQDYNYDLKALITSLINCLELNLNFIDTVNDKLLHYLYLNILCSICKNHKSYLYFEKLKDLIKVLKVKDSFDLTSIVDFVNGEVENNDIKKFYKSNEAFRLLKYLNTNTIHIYEYDNEQHKLFNLKKLIESYNLLLLYSTDVNIQNYLKGVIVNELYSIVVDSSEKNILEIEKLLIQNIETVDFINDNKTKNLGSESKIKEFKTSIFHSASDIPQEKVILKTISGFLNSYEEKGSLFIGVNDKGEIVGIHNDLNFRPEVKTLDQYQNYIQSLIVKVFPKAINSLIDYKFEKYNNYDYLEIIVPSYHKPVDLYGEFYQRQGVQTRILKGSDLTDFMFNKANGITNIHPYESRIIVNKFNDLNNTENREVYQKDYFEEFKQEGQIKIFEYNSNESNLLAYLYIFSDGSYIVSSNEYKNYEFKVKITEFYKLGYILMCYDNACVNKVEVRSVLTKSFNRKYQNGKSNYGKLMTVVLALSNADIIIETKRFNKDYIKIFNVNNISNHTHLGLKGNCIVQEDFDKLANYSLKYNLNSKFNYFRRESKAGLGSDIDRNKSLYTELLNI